MQKYKGKEGCNIARFEKDWNPEQRYNALVKMDAIVHKYADVLIIDLVWDKYGGGRKGNQKETIAFRQEIANNNEKFTDALYAFAVCMIYDKF